MKEKSFLPGWFRFTISMMLLVIIAIKLDFSKLLITFHDVRLDMIFVLVLMALGLRIFAAYRWFILYSCTNSSVTLTSAIKITFIANFFGQFLPGAVGIEAIRIYSMAKNTSDIAGSFTSVLIERLFGLFSLVLMVFVGLSLAQQKLPGSFSYMAWLALSILIIAFFLLLNSASRSAIENLLPDFITRRIEEKLKKVYACIDLYKQQSLKLTISLILAVLFQVLRVILCIVAALAFRVDPSILHFFIFVPIIVFITLLPISISGLGVREAGFVYFFSTYEIMDAQTAFAMSILIFSADTLLNLIGAYFYVIRKRDST